MATTAQSGSAADQDTPSARPTRAIHEELNERFFAAQRGDRSALEAVIATEWPLLCRIVAFSLRSSQECEDLTQEAFARALPRIATIEGGLGGFRAYLTQIARNLVRDGWRRKRPEAFTGDSDDLPCPSQGPEASVIAAADQTDVVRAMERLSNEHREVLQLRIVEGRSSDDVATIMNRSAAAVRQLQHRALIQLRHEFLTINPSPSEATHA